MQLLFLWLYMCILSQSHEVFSNTCMYSGSKCKAGLK